MGKCEVFGMDAVGNCAGNSIFLPCGKVFLWIFLAVLEQCRICYGLDHTDCGHYFREKET